MAPEASLSYGDLAAALSADYGLAPDDWQRLVLDDWLAESDGRWASLTCGLSVPRQNGKNGALEVRELFGMIGRGEKILHTAHQVKTAQKHFRRLKGFFGKRVNDPHAPFPELNALVAELRNVNGQEAIFLHNGGSVEIVARSQGSGRGFTVDTIVCDEAQDMGDDDLEALLSTSSSSPLGNPQWIFTGTPPGPKANGAVFTRVRSDALGETPEKVCWHEWSSPKDVDLDDEEEWKRANPATSTRLQMDVIRGERARFSPGGFKRERLGMWEDRERLRQVIPSDIWGALVDSGPLNGTPPGAIGVDASHDRLLVIAGCWATEGGAHVELLEVGYSDTQKVVEWLTARARAKRIPVVIDSLSPAASLVPALRAARVRVNQTSASDMAKACGLFYDDAMGGRLTHVAQEPLDIALAGAKQRRIGDAGGWGWDRKNPDINISPLVAVSLARFGLSTIRPRTSNRGGRAKKTDSRRAAVLA